MKFFFDRTLTVQNILYKKKLGWWKQNLKKKEKPYNYNV